ncbi:MAG: nucleotidyltransferase domain-containing protein [Candidatus Bathyarchaeia archaeon]
MLKLRRVDIEKSEEILRKINDYINEVVKRLNPHLVILFGSFATGDINEGSDIDILVVANFKEDFLDRIRTLMDINTFKMPIEPVGYTPEEFDEMKNRKNAFIMEVLEKGKVMYRL